MRFSDRITFVVETSGGYNPDKGEHEEPTISKEMKPCNLSTLGVDRTKQLFGEIDTELQVARLQRPYNEPFNYVIVGNKKYNIKRQSTFRKDVFFLEGVKS